MKFASIFAFLLFFSFACGNRNQVKTVEFEIYNTSHYCGGAAPDDELLEELATPVKSNDTLYVYYGPDRQGDPSLLIVNNGKGKLLGLVDGAYFAYRFSPALIDKMEMSPDPMAGCYMNYYNNHSFVFEVTQDTKIVRDTFIKECDPCVEPAP